MNTRSPNPNTATAVTKEKHSRTSKETISMSLNLTAIITTHIITRATIFTPSLPSSQSMTVSTRRDQDLPFILRSLTEPIRTPLRRNGWQFPKANERKWNRCEHLQQRIAGKRQEQPLHRHQGVNRQCSAPANEPEQHCRGN